MSFPGMPFNDSSKWADFCTVRRNSLSSIMQKIDRSIAYMSSLFRCITYGQFTGLHIIPIGLGNSKNHDQSAYFKALSPRIVRYLACRQRKLRQIWPQRTYKLRESIKKWLKCRWSFVQEPYAIVSVVQEISEKLRQSVASLCFFQEPLDTLRID